MFYYVSVTVYFVLTTEIVLTHFTTTNAVKYIGVPQPYEKTIAYDNHTTADHVIIPESEYIGADGDLKKIYTCRIGGINFKDLNEKLEFSDCFPFPSFGAIPKHEDQDLLNTICENLAKLYIVYWYKRNLVWCRKANSQIIPNGAAKVIQVSREYENWYGSKVIYNYRSKAIYQIKTHTRTTGSLKKLQKLYTCKIGEFNFNNSRLDTMVDCFPYPLKKATPKSTDEESAISKCMKFANDCTVYWLNGRIVWCAENHIESNLIPYRRGAHVLNLDMQFWNVYGDKIYYDETAPASYQIIKEVTTPQHVVTYVCILGGFDSKKEFSVCFPRPKRYELLSHNDESYINHECGLFAQKYLSYWENDRLVWCEIRTPGLHKATIMKQNIIDMNQKMKNVFKSAPDTVIQINKKKKSVQDSPSLF